MDKIQLLLQKSNQALKTADHLTYITYPLINDVKLSITIVENLYLSLVYSMNALLRYDYLFKRIPYFPEDFNLKLEIFRSKVAPRYKIEKEFIILIQDIKEIMDKHKSSNMEFRRKNKFVICTDNFKTQTITINTIKEYLSKTKPFVQRINEILEKNEEISGR